MVLCQRLRVTQSCYFMSNVKQIIPSLWLCVCVVNPSPQEPRQKGYKFKASLSYIVSSEPVWAVG